MVHPKKQETVALWKDILSRCPLVIGTDFKGLSVANLNSLRRKLREQGIEYKVIKNTLLRLAAQGAGKDGLLKVIEGPTALALAYGEVVASAKAFREAIRSSGVTLPLRGAVMDNRFLTPEELSSLATLPPREVLQAQLLGWVQVPLYRLLFALQAPLQGLANLLEQRRRQLEAVKTS